MSLKTRDQEQFDDDEDLKALRLAALQTLKKHAPNSCIPQPLPKPALPLQHVRPRTEFRGGMRRGRNMRNGGFQRHHVNPNLIAIVPINEALLCPKPELPVLKSKPALAVNNTPCKLVLPQDRYCKTEEASEGKQPEVSTKFNRFDHSSSESSGEESEEEQETQAVEDTEETAASERDEGEEAAAPKESEAEIDPDILLMEADEEDESLEKLMNEMEEEMGLETKRTAKSAEKTKSAQTSRKAISETSNSHRKTKSTSPRLINGERESKPAGETGETSLRASPKTAPSPQRTLKPRSPSRSPRRPPPNRMRRSRSLSSVRSPARLRSRSPPFRSQRSPRRKYSPADRYLPPRSPRRDTASWSRRPLSPRSPSPRLRRSPRRSPTSSRWVSPRKQSISPKFRRQSVSPASRHALSPRTRRSISPRRPSPISYRKRSPSPARRNQSPPPRRYSPPRRNPSPPRRRVSHSSSRSPVRRRSPTQVSRSSGMKASPWSPLRQSNRATPSPAYKPKSLSPCGRGRKDSCSPNRKLDKSSSSRLHSPHRGDGRRALQDSRVNNNHKSVSPLPEDDSPSRHTPPSLAHSPGAKSWSCTSSLTLSPSPERSASDAARRVKSPLRIQKRRQDLAKASGFQDNQSQSGGSAQPSEEDGCKLPKRRKESRGKSKKNRNRKSNESKKGEAVGETKPKREAAGAADGALSVLEARRRKFESVVPIESSNKRIRLRKSDEPTSSPPEADKTPEPQGDDLDQILDQALENSVELWVDEESDGEKKVDTRFKAAERRGSGDVKPDRAPEESGRGRNRTVRSLAASSAGREGKPGLREEGADRAKEPQSAMGPLEEGATDRVAASRDGDLRAELSRRRAERLTLVGSVHESMPARLVQNAFKDAVGKKNLKRLERRERRSGGKQSESVKGDSSDGRRVLVLKSAAAEQQVPSISVTIPKEEKHRRSASPPAGKLPIHMRLGLAAGAGAGAAAGGSGSGGRRRGSRKVKLKRSVLLAPSTGDKEGCLSVASLSALYPFLRLPFPAIVRWTAATDA